MEKRKMLTVILLYILFCLIVIWPLFAWSIYWMDSDEGKHSVRLTVGFFLATGAVSLIPFANIVVFVMSLPDATEQIVDRLIPNLTAFFEKPVIEIKGKNDGKA